MKRISLHVPKNFAPSTKNISLRIVARDETAIWNFELGMWNGYASSIPNFKFLIPNCIYNGTRRNDSAQLRANRVFFVDKVRGNVRNDFGTGNPSEYRADLEYRPAKSRCTDFLPGRSKKLPSTTPVCTVAEIHYGDAVTEQTHECHVVADKNVRDALFALKFD